MSPDISEMDPSYDLTTVKINLKFPKNNFVLHTLEACPYSLKSKLAFEYKLLVYPDIEYWVNNWVPQNLDNFYNLESRDKANKQFPQLKIQHQRSLEETWINDSTEILRMLDSTYTENLLFHEKNTALNFEINLLEDWIDESFKLPFLYLQFLNKSNLNKFILKWKAKEDGLLNNWKLKFFVQQKISSLLSHFPDKKKACDYAVKRFEEDLLTMISDRLDFSYSNGSPFLTGDLLTAADLSLYSFLSLLLTMEEAGLVYRRPILTKFISAIEKIPLGRIERKPQKKNNSQKQKMVFIGNDKK